MPSKHAACGGSSVSRWLRCPGSVRLLADLPRTTSKAADRGTMLHAAMEAVMKGPREPASLVATGFSFNGVKLDHTDARKMLIPARHATLQFFGSQPYQMEVRVKHARSVWGTADLLSADGVADYKFGSGIVEVADNEQLKFYASAALEQRTFAAGAKKIRTAIIQPDAPKVLQTHTYSVDELHAFGIEVRAAAKVALSRKYPAPLVPGVIQCKWCEAKKLNICPALKLFVPNDLAANLKGLALRC